jgi:hypothetical protein
MDAGGPHPDAEDDIDPDPADDLFDCVPAVNNPVLERACVYPSV